MLVAPAALFLASAGCNRSKVPTLAIDSDLTRLDLSEASAALKRREISPVDLTMACLARIDRLDRRLNSFITVTADVALAQAREAERLLAAGTWLGPLHGIPIAIKDNIDTAGILTTAASGVFANRIPSEDAEVIRRLKAAGAIILGKLNMHEFALGTTSAISHFGPVHNPWDFERVAGGSSGGSAAAVAAGLCFGAVGTDTGGSVRIPASSCGIVGLKPTFGVVSTKGTIPISNSFDHVGPMCRTVVDAALMFSVMTDNPVAKEFDPTVLPNVAGFRVGIVKATSDICDSPIEIEVQTAFDAAVDIIRSLGVETRECVLPAPDLGRVIDYESYAYHAKYLAASPGSYDQRTRKTLMDGHKITKSEYDRILADLERHRHSIGRAFADIDLMIVPTLPGLPIRIKEAVDPFSLGGCTFAFSIAGIPCISVPCGFSSTGLPIGMLIAGTSLGEGRLLALAAAYEKAAGWDKRRPQL